MEYVLVDNINIVVGIDFTRLHLFRVFSTAGKVNDILIDKESKQALVSFEDSASAQLALLRLNNMLFLGEQIHLQISLPPTSELPNLLVTLQPTNILFFSNVSYMLIYTLCKRIRGIQRIVSLRANTCVVTTEAINVALVLKKAVCAQLNR